MDDFEPHSAFDVVRIFVLNDLCDNYIVCNNLVMEIYKVGKKNIFFKRLYYESYKNKHETYIYYSFFVV